MNEQEPDKAQKPDGPDGIAALMWLFLVVGLAGGFLLIFRAFALSLTLFGEIPTTAQSEEARAWWNLTFRLLLGYGFIVSSVAAILRRWVWCGLFASVTAITGFTWLWLASL